jgi:hypothetical protein
MGSQQSKVIVADVAVVPVKERDPKLGVNPPIVLFKKKDVYDPGVIFRHSKVNKPNMATGVDKPVTRVVFPVGGN